MRSNSSTVIIRPVRSVPWELRKSLRPFSINTYSSWSFMNTRLASRAHESETRNYSTTVFTEVKKSSSALSAIFHFTQYSSRSLKTLQIVLYALFNAASKNSEELKACANVSAVFQFKCVGWECRSFNWETSFSWSFVLVTSHLGLAELIRKLNNSIDER